MKNQIEVKKDIPTFSRNVLTWYVSLDAAQNDFPIHVSFLCPFVPFSLRGGAYSPLRLFT